MEMRKLLNIMESIESGESSTTQGLEALQKIIDDTRKLLQSAKSGESVPQESIEEGKISSGLIGLAMAGMAALGSGGAQAQSVQQSVAKEMAFCAGVLIQAAGEMEKHGKFQDAANYKKNLNALANIAQPVIGGEELKRIVRSGIADTAGAINNNKIDYAIRSIARCDAMIGKIQSNLR